MEGIELTERDLLKTLERHGIRKHRAEGRDASTPTCTRPCSRCPTRPSPNGTVREVVQAGFVIGDRVLRPALVGVAKGGPKPGGASNGTGESVDRSA